MSRPLTIKGVRWLPFFAFLLLLGLGDAALAQDPCAGSKRLLRLGGRNTVFYGAVDDVSALQTMFRERGDQITALLRQVGFTGDPNDLFEAVRSGDGIVDDSLAVPQGTKLGWMFFRRRNQPSAMLDICWAANDPFEAFKLVFDSGETRYTMVVPKVCGNLALVGQEAAPVKVIPPPECALSVNDSCQSLEFDINATGSTAESVRIVVDGPGGQSQLGASDASAPLRWRFRDETLEADFSFTAIGETQGARGETLQCRENVRVTRDCCEEGPPSITLAADLTEVRPDDPVQLTATPSVHECARLRGVTIDGQSVSAPYVRSMSWSEPGEYTVTARVTDDEGQTAESSVTITVKPNRGWTVRPFLAAAQVGNTIERQSIGDQRRAYQAGSDLGLGLEAEYQLNPRFGIAFGALTIDTDLELMFDIGDLWETGKDDFGLFTLFAGPMFHLTPDSRVDFFLGPIVHYTSLDGVSYNLLGVGVDEDFDDELSFGAQVGLDLPFKPDGRFGLHLGALYLDLEASSSKTDLKLDLSPLSANVGLFYRFW